LCGDCRGARARLAWQCAKQMGQLREQLAEAAPALAREREGSSRPMTPRPDWQAAAVRCVWGRGGALCGGGGEGAGGAATSEAGTADASGCRGRRRRWSCRGAQRSTTSPRWWVTWRPPSRSRSSAAGRWRRGARRCRLSCAARAVSHAAPRRCSRPARGWPTCGASARANRRTHAR
jgi:hypothetical protein